MAAIEMVDVHIMTGGVGDFERSKLREAGGSVGRVDMDWKYRR